jgi:hypothetical protein
VGGPVIARSIIEMRDAHPSLFAPQSWFDNEPFAHLKLVPPIGLPTHLVRHPEPPEDVDEALTDAVLLVALFLRYPNEALWRDYLWAADTDAQGQRVYVGGTANGRGFEIHRHLHLNHRWSVPVWR